MTQTLRESIGCFEIEQLSAGRWRVTNIHTMHAHVTYGTKQEVYEQLEIQTKAWEQRLSSTKGARMHNSSWRTQRTSEINRQKTKTTV